MVAASSASAAELPARHIAVHAPNALAPEITAAASTAVDLFDRYAESGDRSVYRDYVDARASTARLAARQVGYAEFDMVMAWARAPLDHQRAVLAAMTQIGVPYRSDTSTPGVGFDCSGLTTFAWGSAGVRLLRQSGSQIKAAAPRDRTTAQAGDLVYYPGHVMMYLGVGDAVVHAVQPGRTVEIDQISVRRTRGVRFGDPTN